ncbi:MAG: DUF6884 domain-containing protein, partial [Solirubrobacteraceae bacterium]
DEQLDPYDLALGDLSAAERREWGARVVHALEGRCGGLGGMIFEVHAGAHYRDAIEPGVLAGGGQLRAPLRHVPLGSQPGWYRAHLDTHNEPEAVRLSTSTTDEFKAAVRALDGAPTRVPARHWPHGLANLDRPGLYSWWVDEDGAEHLSEGLSHLVPPGRIYAGQTGATRWPSGSAGEATLASRIGAQHLRGRIRASTIRLTLAACLLEPLSLIRTAPRRLAPPSENRLSAWMRDHLEVAVLPIADRDVLGDLEHRVLLHLDPPLNLDAMPANQLRFELSRRRASLA